MRSVGFEFTAFSSMVEGVDFGISMMGESFQPSSAFSPMAFIFNNTARPSSGTTFLREEKAMREL